MDFKRLLTQTIVSAYHYRLIGESIEVIRMTGNTVTRADLTEAVYRALGVSRNESAVFVERILEEISSSLERG